MTNQCSKSEARMVAGCRARPISSKTGMVVHNLPPLFTNVRASHNKNISRAPKSVGRGFGRQGHETRLNSLKLARTLILKFFLNLKWFGMKTEFEIVALVGWSSRDRAAGCQPSTAGGTPAATGAAGFGRFRSVSSGCSLISSCFHLFPLGSAVLIIKIIFLSAGQLFRACAALCRQRLLWCGEHLTQGDARPGLACPRLRNAGPLGLRMAGVAVSSGYLNAECGTRNAGCGVAEGLVGDWWSNSATSGWGSKDDDGDDYDENQQGRRVLYG